MKTMKALILICILSAGCAHGAFIAGADIQKGDRQAVKIESNVDKIETTGIKTDKIETDISGSLLRKTDNSVDNRVITNDPKWAFWSNIINGAYNLVPFVLTILLMIRFMRLTIGKMLDVIDKIAKVKTDSADRPLQEVKIIKAEIGRASCRERV